MCVMWIDDGVVRRRTPSRQLGPAPPLPAGLHSPPTGGNTQTLQAAAPRAGAAGAGAGAAAAAAAAAATAAVMQENTQKTQALGTHLPGTYTLGEAGEGAARPHSGGRRRAGGGGTCGGAWPTPRAVKAHGTLTLPKNQVVQETCCASFQEQSCRETTSESSTLKTVQHYYALHHTMLPT